MSLMNPVASTASQRQVAPPTAAWREEIDTLVDLARNEGYHVEGMPLAHALTGPDELKGLRQTLFNNASLAWLKSRVKRIEFIAEGPLPPELLLEPAAKSQPIYRQVIDYTLCKGCRLCIQVCPKHVYSDDGFGKPDELRHAEECTGNMQCAQCVYICPERAISLEMTNPLYESTLFVQLPNAYAMAEAARTPARDFFVPNPLTLNAELKVGVLPVDDLAGANRVLEVAGFYPLIETRGVQKHFVDSREPDAELDRWARENGRSPRLVTRAVALLYRLLPSLEGVVQGQYELGAIIHRVADEILNAEIDPDTQGGLKLLKSILEESRIAQTHLGAKCRPIGGLLPPGTSTAWKTPYGNEVPVYSHLDKCLGPECALCVTHCPEGSGGEHSAIRMIPLVPLSTVPALVRGLKAFLLKADGSHSRIEDMEDLIGRQPFVFEVDADYCKSCGICISCCPHDVIEGAQRSFDMGEAA
ncbi:MAG: 4Fe-4S binding protein [Sulfuritalea sp.]|jgi:2-oxoglutarate ferredoxin oxidoreductase subunit delta|nr:4Fe-4S binding protein [Sulfuritalea sp.]